MPAGRVGGTGVEAGWEVAVEEVEEPEKVEVVVTGVGRLVGSGVAGGRAGSGGGSARRWGGRRRESGRRRHGGHGGGGEVVAGVA